MGSLVAPAHLCHIVLHNLGIRSKRITAGNRIRFNSSFVFLRDCACASSQQPTVTNAQ